MKKRLISLAVAVVMLFSMLCPAVYADDETASFDTCTHEWEIPIRSGYSVTIPGTDVSFSVKTEQCAKCKWYKHVATIIVAEFTYYSPLNVDSNGLVPTELATYWANVWYNIFGKNATAKKFTAGGGSTDGSGVGRRPAGYADDNGTPSYDSDGDLQLVVYPQLGLYTDSGLYFYDYPAEFSKNYDLSSWHVSGLTVTGRYLSSSGSDYFVSPFNYKFTAPISGTYFLKTQQYYVRGFYNANFVLSSLYFAKGAYSVHRSEGDSSTVCNSDVRPYVSAQKTVTSFSYAPIILTVIPDTPVINQRTNITINNNTWNGNIYVDNSNNLTYIYPQYTTINENNETVTNISTNPIIYNSETKQYYTYDSVTQNYYYITYNDTPATPTPSPSPTPDPDNPDVTPTPSPSPDTPSGGDTSGILAVLVEIRDNMIAGFADFKAALVAGFADLSANFQLAIDNLNLNITNIFNKKFPDQSTPETAAPTPSPKPSTPESGEPTPSPSPEPSPSPSPSPNPDTPDVTPTPAPTDKPDSGDKTNNFWTIIFPKGDDSSDGKKGIFWALVSLILALIAFFTNLAAGVGYLFPFLPDGVVMTINTCLFVVFLFTIIKFIMRSK